MKLNKVFFSMLSLLFFVAFLSPLQAYGETTLSDGTYKVGFTVLHASDDSASIANDYWDKPATLNVKDGVTTVQMQLNHSDWIKEFQVMNNGAMNHVAVISSDSTADTRVVQFQASDLSSPIESKIHVIVPDIDYDNHYTVRLSFDMSSLNQTSAAEETQSDESDESQETASTNESSSSTDESDETVTSSSTGSDGNNSSSDENVVSNPQTSDLTNYYLYILVLIGSIGGLIVHKKLNTKEV
ncbi:heme uptake protein IsdC [Salipaludibacillus sp. HK11]|uniref:heme uptake protein IsdC n=1 Tax=Salipaludibacillus sp. HK11 TaxID=3394320 RepID=UPI0039FDA7F3